VIAALSPGAQRRAQRRVHLLAGAVLAAYVYAPLGPELEYIVRLAIFPSLTVTGIAMWQTARIRRVLRSLRTRREAQGLRTSQLEGRHRHATPRDG
jgi:hypothetical protein